MAEFVLARGKRYRATLTLGWVEQLASNTRVAEEFAKAGFGDVVVQGEGATRVAEGVWTRENMQVALPEQVSEVTELA